MKKNSAQKKIYRFALYGRAASGKTCILAALAMKRTAHPSGYTCTWIPVPEPSGKNKKDDTEAFEQGRTWLQEAISNLSCRTLPAPNPNRSTPLRYLYQFSTPGSRSFLVELIDYSGELIDPDITRDDLAQKLHTHLTEMDGMLVLAEAPLPDQDMEPLSDEMLKLEQAFVTLQGKKSKQRSQVPVALLINKWDRRFSDDQPITTENSQQLLKNFLRQEPEPPHRSLINALQNSLPPELFQIFPVSAFGPHELVATETGAVQERPREVKPLRSFGLEDGFVWLAQKKDAQDIAAFIKKNKQLNPLKFWQFFLPWRAQLQKENKSLTKRFLPESDEYKQLGALHQTTQRTTFYQLLTTLSFILFLLLSGEALYDGFIYKTIRLHLENPLTTRQKIKKDEKWLEAYYVSPPYRHFLSKFLILEKNEAKNAVKKNRQEQEERFWQELQKTQEQVLRRDLAQQYLALFPNGLHVEAAAGILEKTRFSLLAHENKKFLEEMENRIRAVMGKKILNQREIDGLRAMFRIPWPQAMSKDLIAKEHTLRRELGKIQIRLAKTQGSAEWFRFKEHYMELMRLGDINGAALHLQQWPARTDAFFALEKDFENRSLAALQNRVKQLKRNRQWQEARELVKKTYDDNQLFHTYSEKQKKILQDLLQSLSRGEDNFLYAQLKQKKDQQSALAYLKKAPLQTMRPEALAWNEYFMKTHRKIDLQLAVAELTWGDLPFTYNNEHADITITLNGQEILYIPDVEASRFTTVKELGKTGIRESLDSTAKLGIHILSKKSWTSWRDGDAGNTEWTGSVRELEKKSFILSGDRQKNTMLIRLLGIPTPPPLPAWKPPQ